jgi:hypothetical protein
MGKCSRDLISVRPEVLRRVSGSWLGRRFAPLGLVWDDCSTPWRLLPARELGGGSPATCWRRLDEWAKAGVFDRLHLDVLDRLAEQGGLDARECGLGQHARETRGDHVGADPVDPGKPGSKIHLVCDGGGLPLTVAVTAANVPDVAMLAAMVDDIPPVRTPAGRRRTWPGKLDADEGYDRVLQPALTTWRRAVAATRATGPGRSGKYLPSRKHHGTFLVVKYCR